MKKNGKEKKYDLKGAQSWYLRTEGATLKKVSERFDIPKSTVETYSKRENWRQRKKDFKKLALDKTVRMLANEESDKIAALAYAADLAVEQITDILAQPEKDDADILDTKTLRDCVSALKDLTAIIRNVNDILTPGEEQSRRIAQEKWDLEKSERMSSGEDENLTIEILSGEEFSS